MNDEQFKALKEVLEEIRDKYASVLERLEKIDKKLGEENGVLNADVVIRGKDLVSLLRRS